MEVQQIDMSDEELFNQLYEAAKIDAPFIQRLINERIMAHRAGDEEATIWINNALNGEVT